MSKRGKGSRALTGAISAFPHFLPNAVLETTQGPPAPQSGLTHFGSSNFGGT